MKTTTTPKRIYLNQDDAAFYRCHPVSDMTVEALEATVDYYAKGSQLAGLAFCVNMQRALFASNVWETMVDGYDPALGDDQPVIKRGGESHGLAELRRKNIDQFEVWLRRARHHGIEAFLTMRMNDCHGLEGHGDWWKGGRVKGGDQDHFHFHASEFWKKHPELRRAPYRYERSFESGFDFKHEVIRLHHLKFIAEVFERYDMDGFELDWMRWLFFFAPGGEAKGRAFLTEFVGQVNELRRQAEKRWGHPIALRHRVPAEPQACLEFGFDVAAWAEMGNVQQLILSAFGGAANFDYPIALWRRLLGSEVKIFALVETGASAFPGVSASDYQFLYGSASAVLERGADGVYLFNECYRETGSESERALLLDVLNSSGDTKTLSGKIRRYAVSYPQVHAPGQAMRNMLPIPLTNPIIGASFGRMAENITLRIPIGQKDAGSEYLLCLGFSAETPAEAIDSMPVRVNTQPVKPGEKPELGALMIKSFPGKPLHLMPPQATLVRYYKLPAEALQSDVNVIEFEPLPREGNLIWAEIIAVPR